MVDCNIPSVKIAINEHKSARQVSCRYLTDNGHPRVLHWVRVGSTVTHQNEAPSSSANSTPPIGAPNAAATPGGGQMGKR